MSGPADLAAGLRHVGGVARRRGQVVLISDFATDPGDWETALGAVALRHSVLCVEVVDPRDLELPRAGVLPFVDPATGTVREVNTNSARIRAAYATAAADQRANLRRAIRAAGADHLVLSTDGDSSELVAARRTR
jgi:uncharacterized protein (DUF58 family)